MQITFANKRPWLLGIMVGGGFVSLLELFGFCRLSFTTTAAMAGAAAVTQLMTIRFDHETPRSIGNIGAWILCLLLMVAGYCLRQAVMLAFLPFVLLILVWRLVQSKNHHAQLLRFSLIGLALFCVLIGVREIELQDADKADMLSFHQARISLFDYTDFESDLTPALQADTVLSEADIQMIQQWYFMDSKVDAQALSTLEEAYASLPSDTAIIRLADFFDTNPRYVLVMVALLFLTLLCLIKHGKTLPSLVSLCALMGSGVLLLYLGMEGRVLFRGVDTIVLPCGALLACFLVMKSPKPTRAKRYVLTAITLALVAVVGMHFVATYQVLGTSMDTTSLQRESELETYALSNPDTLIVRSPNLLRDTRLFPDVSAGIPTNLIIWGDWYCKTPTWNDQFKAVGLNAQTFTPSDWLNDAILLATVNDDIPDALIATIEESTGNEVQAVLVDTYGTLQFYHFEEMENNAINMQ